MTEVHNDYPAAPTAVPAGYELVHRGAPIRLGPGFYVHNTTVHASLGITSISKSSSGYLEVHTDFQPNEKVIYTKASVDLQLAAKGVDAGCSGGASIHQIGIYRPTNDPLKRFKLAPDDEWFGELDNLWFLTVSIRPIAS